MTLSAPPRTQSSVLPDPLAPFIDVVRRVDGMASWSAGHSKRVAVIARAIAIAARWAPPDVARIACTAELHDVGKLCVAEEVLGHKGPLDAAARAEIELHPALGGAMLATVLDAEEVGWVRHHHERWDGGGYPSGLRGDAIPAGASIIALAEAWDTIRSPGPTTPHSLTADEALGEYRSGAGSQFAPWAVDALEHAVSGLEPRLVGSHIAVIAHANDAGYPSAR